MHPHVDSINFIVFLSQLCMVRSETGPMALSDVMVAGNKSVFPRMMGNDVMAEVSITAPSPPTHIMMVNESRGCSTGRVFPAGTSRRLTSKYLQDASTEPSGEDLYSGCTV